MKKLIAHKKVKPGVDVDLGARLSSRAAISVFGFFYQHLLSLLPSCLGSLLHLGVVLSISTKHPWWKENK